jgi:hypothetical protein
MLRSHVEREQRPLVPVSEHLFSPSRDCWITMTRPPTWWLAPLFRQRDPRVRLDESRMIVKSGKLVTAGVALSHMDLAFWIIRHRSPRLAAFLRKSTGRRRLPSQRFNSVEGLVFAFNSTLSALAGAISFPDDYRGRGFSSDNMSGFAVRRHWR